MTTTIAIDRLKLFARHGVGEQERRAGNRFEVSATLRYDASNACETDNIEAAINYADVIETITTEMVTPSKLLEHVAARIAKAICNRFPENKGGSVTVTKLCPPCGVELAGVSITLEW